MKKSLPAFDPQAFLAQVGGGRSIARFRKNAKIFAQGEAADAVFYIQKGKVKISILSMQGREAVIAILGKDEFAGEGCLAGQQLRISTATALTDCEVMRLEKGGNSRDADPAARIFRAVRRAPAHPQHPHRGRPGGPAFQLQ